MAQASSVPAREPSMEEILASIRRIIEDSDNAHVPGGAGPTSEAGAPVAGDPVHAVDPHIDEGEPDDIDAFRSELSAMEQETEPRDEPAAEAPPAVRGAFASHRADETAPELHSAPEPVAFEPARPSARQETAVSRPQPDHAPEAYRPAAGEAVARTSIISDTAGRQVAAAFEELQDAFASSQRRSFDDIAEDLLRPMLQDWLDNNLPVLVERLVREEIERVARGSR